VKHVVVDLISSSPALSSVEAVYRMLDELPVLMGMQKITVPQVVKYDPPPEKNGHEAGVSGNVIIAESGIDIHTWPEYERAYIGVFSCRDFSTMKVVEYITELFKPEAMQTQYIKRMGLK